MYSWHVFYNIKLESHKKEYNQGEPKETAAPFKADDKPRLGPTCVLLLLHFHPIFPSSEFWSVSVSLAITSSQQPCEAGYG